MAVPLKVIGYADVPTSLGKLRCPILLVDSIKVSEVKVNVVVNDTLEGSVWAAWTGDTLGDRKFNYCDSFNLIGVNSTYPVTVDPGNSSTAINFGDSYFGIPLFNTSYGYVNCILALVTDGNENYCFCSCTVPRDLTGEPYGALMTTVPPSGSNFGYTLFTFVVDTTSSWTTNNGSGVQDVIANSDIAISKDDPYANDPNGTTGTGGGTGNFDGTGDDIDIPSLPTLSAVNTNFITLFNPTIEQLKNLANYMWSSGFDLETFKKLFADPMDCILGLSIVPVAVPNGETSIVSVGNISTGVSMTKAASQYVTVDCGTLNVNEYWGAYLDYDPYTKAEIYLPYIGTHALSVDDIMGKSVHVVYHVDILSGACAAYVKCGGSVLYTFIGQCSSSIPINGNDWTNVINGVLSIAGAVGSMVATGGASAPMAAGMIASTAVNGMKPNVEKSGSMSGTGGMLGIQTPFLILTRPRQALPARQNKFTGYPSFITESLGDLSGYTEIEEIHLENISATESELSEIENLLKSGVIF